MTDASTKTLERRSQPSPLVRADPWVSREVRVVAV